MSVVVSGSGEEGNSKYSADAGRKQSEFKFKSKNFRENRQIFLRIDKKYMKY